MSQERQLMVLISRGAGMKNMKKCFKCLEEKDLSEFYRHAAMRDGLLNKCKSCACRDVRQNRRESDTARLYDAVRSKSAKRLEAAKKYTAAIRKIDPVAYVARTAVNNAVRDGRLKRLSCEFCGGGKVQAHHSDYRKPLDVTWLCAKCHLRFHAIQNKGLS